MDYANIITVEPGKMGGKPCIRGLRFTVYDLLEYLAGGMTVPELLAEFPVLQLSDVLATYAYMADQDRRMARAA